MSPKQRVRPRAGRMFNVELSEADRRLLERVVVARSVTAGRSLAIAEVIRELVREAADKIPKSLQGHMG